MMYLNITNASKQDMIVQDKSSINQKLNKTYL